MEPLSLFNIKFPIYTITKNHSKIWEEFNVLYIETSSGIYVLDNKNIDGDTLGKRRLKITQSELYRPRKVYYNIPQMLHSKDSYFIDSNGTPFKYKKEKYVPLVYYKVDSIYQVEDGECVIEVTHINYSYKTNCRLAHSVKYIGLLITEFGFIPFEFSDVYKPKSKRKI